MSIYIFLGPTLAVAEAESILAATYLAPVKMGDIYALMNKKPKIIGIIDGFFEQTPAVWHKEILYALSQGVRVVGSSSMGALRAAELHPFGMEGVGTIFEKFRSGVYEDDDEVTVVHGPAETGYQSISTAMVNIRYGLELAEKEGLLSAENRDKLTALAKNCFYPERGWDHLYDLAEGQIPRERLAILKHWVSDRAPDLKREDAMALLKEIKASRRRRAEPVAWTFEPTIFWEHLTQTAAPAKTGQVGGPTREKVRNHIRFAVPERRQVLRGALFHFLVKSESQRQGIEVSDMTKAMRDFRRSRELHTASALQQWMAENHLSREECLDLVRAEGLAEGLMQRFPAEIDEFLVHETQLRGTFGGLLREVDDKWRTLLEAGIKNPSEADTEAPLNHVLAWYQDHWGPVQQSWEHHAFELGFGSVRQFLTELFAEYIYQHNRPQKVQVQKQGA